MTARHALGLDVGGTFTDVVLVDLDNGGVRITKTTSVPGDPAQGFFDGVDGILGESGVDVASLDLVLHGSTVATNAVLEGKWARTGMLVTDGFKYVLEIGRAEVPRKENLYAWVKPARPVPPRRIFEVPERVRVDGSVESGLDEAACRDAARSLSALGVESVAIMFLHGYANPDHEQRAAAIVREELPEVEIAISSEVLPVFREFERGIATVLNAGVQPRVGRYIAKLRDGLEARGIGAPLLIMKSNGGVFTPAQAARQSIDMALSGPAAGATGAASVSSEAGFERVITIDMGGTSADVCLIRDATPAITMDGEIAGFPLSIPMVDIHTIGAGGGSIAQVTSIGGLHVGPESAGADPGPACYGKGGTRPTVTDANLVLGRIPPHLLYGRIAIDTDRARAAIEAQVAEPLGLDVVQAALGIIALVNNNMVGALKVVSVERGHDPADFALCALGGAGPVHAGELMEQLGAARALVPRYPGILCAIGLLTTDQRYDFVRTCVQRAGAVDVGRVAGTYQELEDEAHRRLEAERVAVENRRLERAADLRYERQGVEITVPFAADAVDEATVDALIERFHETHERLYTFSDRDAPVEIINLRVGATGLIPHPPMEQLASAGAGSSAPVAEEREVVLGTTEPVTVPVYRREALQAGHRIEGPGVVDQLDTTTLILAGHQVQVDGYGNLIMQRAPGGDR
jgi:N-methylhydantoinase A